MPEIIKEHIPAAQGEVVFSTESIKARAEQLDSTAIQSIEKKIEQLPPEIGEILGVEERKYLTMLGQKDETTLAHSLGVVEVANGQFNEFADDLAKENVSQEAFLRAAALHDVGKLALPDCILKGKITWRDFENKFFTLKNTNTDFINQRLWERGILSPGQSIRDMSDEKVRDMNLNYRDFVTLEQCFAGDEASLKEIKSYNIDPRATSFMDALRIHEKKSAEIIKQTDIPDKEQIAELAGSHHNYTKETREQFSQTKEILRVSVLASELLHLADVYHSIKQPRSYKQSHSGVEALHIIMTEAKRGIFKLDIAKRWMSRALPAINQVSEEDRLKYEELEQFLEAKDVGVSSVV